MKQTTKFILSSVMTNGNWLISQYSKFRPSDLMPGLWLNGQERVNLTHRLYTIRMMPGLKIGGYVSIYYVKHIWQCHVL